MPTCLQHEGSEDTLLSQGQMLLGCTHEAPRMVKITETERMEAISCGRGGGYYLMGIEFLFRRMRSPAGGQWRGHTAL